MKEGTQYKMYNNSGTEGYLIWEMNELANEYMILK